MQKILNQAEIAEYEGIQAMVNQAAIRVVTAVIMALWGADVGPLTSS